MAGLKGKIHIKELLPKILNGKAIPIVTDCIFKEIELLNNTRGNEADFSGAKLIAKAYFRHKCGHIFSAEKSENKVENKIIFESDSDLNIEQVDKFENNVDVCTNYKQNLAKETNSSEENKSNKEFFAKKSIKGTEKERKFDSFRCILDVVSKNENDKKFIVASQDYLLRKKLNKIPGVPLLYLNGQVPVLEQPSSASNIRNSFKEESRMAPQEWEYSLIPSLKDSLKKNNET
ncbi:tRNA synthetase class II [Cryptosporidium xiaoi]|uniref:tRNA synthetase class II n=1 Tax=Cryptosporidium xiaoi TaxID=659607 RepID=A0AAV9XWV4_9CRYT